MLRKLYWVLTNHCNLGCSYCYYNTGLSHRNLHKIKTADYQAIIPQFSTYFDEIIFTGGEALLAPDLLTLAKLCRNQGLAVSLLTNGVLLSEPMIHKLLKTGFHTISVSLDSLQPKINNAQRGQGALVLANLQRLLKLRTKNLVIEVMQTITAKNLDDLLPMYRFCKKHKLIHWVDPVEINQSINRVKPMALEKLNHQEQAKLEQAMLIWAGSSRSLVDYTKAVMQLIRLQKPTNLYCPMGTDHFVLDVDGSIYPCFKRKDILLGNVLKQPLAKIFDNQNYRQTAQKKLQQAGCVSLGCVCMSMVNKI